MLDIYHHLDVETAPSIGDFIRPLNINGKLHRNIDVDRNSSGTDVSILQQNISYKTASSNPLFL